MTKTISSKAGFTVTNPEEPPFYLILAGRNLWAMKQLIRAGRKGCTPINNPAPRWSAYVYNLRQFGVAIETVTEKHAGAYPGTHARYVLLSKVEGGRT